MCVCVCVKKKGDKKGVDGGGGGRCVTPFVPNFFFTPVQKTGTQKKKDSMSSNVELDADTTSEPPVWPAVQRCDSVFGEDTVYRGTGVAGKRRKQEVRSERSEEEPRRV